MEKALLTVVAMQAALKAGELLRSGLQTSFRIDTKSGKNDLVTELDKSSEECIIKMIKRHFPTHSIMAEESGEHDGNSDVLWIIDPLDGTVNFAHRVPIFSVSIAVAIKKEIQVGVVYQPILHELFIAEKGKGASLNGTPLRVSSKREFSTSFLVTGFPYNIEKNPRHCIDHFAKLLAQGIPIRRLGSAALDLAYTAAGRFDAYWEININPWDIAAGMLLVEEAGGKVTHYDGSPHTVFGEKSIIASNGHLHQDMVAHLKEK
jgi:myo-inositol-1(or 4)-monophosphatase